MTGWTTPLTAGTHLAPEDGTCLMEAVSLVTGDRWTDSPTSTHPLLAHLARRVNDTVADDIRPDLTAFIPDLIATNRHDPLDHARIALACAEYASALGNSPVLAHLQQRAIRRLATDSRADSPNTGLRHVARIARRWEFEHGPARQAVEVAVAQCSKHGDVNLIRLLEVGTTAIGSRHIPESFSCRG